jgi:hypothetical protein
VSAPKVTIAIPAYNAGPFIERCVRSALAAAAPGDEVILLDDASTDDTVARVRRICDARLTVVEHAQNVGRAENVKRALEAGAAPLVQLLPADCALPADGIAERRDALRSHPEATFAFGPAELCDANDRVLGHRRFGSVPALRSALESPGPFLPSNRVFLSTCLIRRRAYETVGGLILDVAPTHRDWDLLLRLGLAGPVAYVPEVAAVERVHDGNVTAELTRDDRIVTAELLVLEAVRRWAASHAPQHSARLDSATRQWAKRRIAHALLAIAGYTESDPARALGCALTLEPALRRSPAFHAALWASALPESVVRPILRPLLAPFDRQRRARWNLSS